MDQFINQQYWSYFTRTKSQVYMEAIFCLHFCKNMFLVEFYESIISETVRLHIGGIPHTAKYSHIMGNQFLRNSHQMSKRRSRHDLAFNDTTLSLKF